MNINILQKDLNKSLGIVQKAVSSRTSIPILSGILLEARDKKLYLTATDLELGIHTYVDCEIIEEGSIVIEPKIISDFVRKFSSTVEMNIQTTENNNVKIKHQHSEINILGNSAQEFPRNTFENEGIEFKLPSKKLQELIKYTIFAVSQDKMRPIFTGCLLEIVNNNINFVAIDTFRMALKKDQLISDNKIDNLSMIIPAKTLQEVNRIIEEVEDDIKIVASDQHVSFKINQTTIISSLLEGKFIDYNSLIREDYATIIALDTAAFKLSLERASVLAREDKNNLIILDIKENTMQINSTSDYGNSEEFIVLDKKEGQDIKIGFNSKYIMDVIKAVESDKLEMRLLGEVNPCFIKENEKDDYHYMILPVRI